MSQTNHRDLRTEPLAAGQEGPEFTSEDETRLRDALKRCSVSTREAACAYRRTRDAAYLPVIIDGLIEHYIEGDARTELHRRGNDVRLVEDLAIDSLTVMELVFLAEEVLQVSIDNDELRAFRTVSDMKEFILSKLAPTRPAIRVCTVGPSSNAFGHAQV